MTTAVELCKTAEATDARANAGRAADATPAEAKPDAILQIAFGFASTKVLLAAVELDLFSQLSRRPMNGDDVAATLHLNPRGVRDFLDALVAMRMLDRDDAHGVYRNTPEAEQFLDAQKPGFIGGMLNMVNQRLYPFWGSLTDALRTGSPQNESKEANGAEIFDALYNDPAKLRQFCSAMTGLSLHTGRAIAKKFPWADHSTMIDVGTAQGALPVEIAKAHPHLICYGYDLPVVRPVFEEYIAAQKLTGRVRFVAGDFLKDATLPKADVLVMGHILHDWDLPTKRMLLAKAYDALPRGGALIVHEALIDDGRRTNVGGLLMSLNMLIETTGGFDFTGADCQQWMRDAGFRNTWVEHLTGTDSMVVAIK